MGKIGGESLSKKKEVKKYYLDHDGEVAVNTLSNKFKVPVKVIRKWMRDENWDSLLYDEDDLEEGTEELLTAGVRDYGLDEQEEAFCFHYLKCHNSTQAALKAGYSSTRAHTKGFKLLQKESIRSFLEALREARNKELFIDGLDLAQEWAKIAFADITDYVTFGTKEVREFNEDGTFTDRIKNFVELKPSSEVDGTILSEVSMGKDGTKVKTYDKLRALEQLDKFINGETKLRTKLIKAQIEKIEKDDGHDTESLLDAYFEKLGAEIDGSE